MMQLTLNSIFSTLNRFRTLRSKAALSNSVLAVVFLSASLFAPGAAAQTVVRVNTNYGSFLLELYDSVTPTTVENFLSYIESGLYVNSIVHRTDPDFVIQGGGWFFNVDTSQIESITKGDPITNEFNLSNLRGTIAMAKLGGDPNSATSEWFINLADNTGLDTNNGGFTVFGRVLGSGMDIVDLIANSDSVNLPPIPQTFDVPLFNYDGENVTIANLIVTQMSVLSSAATPNNFNPATGRLSFRIDYGVLGSLFIDFAVIENGEQIVIGAIPETLRLLPGLDNGAAEFDTITGILTVPELAQDGVVVLRNVVLELTDSERLHFTLRSFE